MPIGGYVVVIEGEAGPIQHELVADAGHPIVGEHISLEGENYAVVAVRHEEDPENRAAARHTYARVFVRLAGDRATRPRTPAESKAPRVLPFIGSAAPPASTTAVILPPSLVAVLVVAGYSEQKIGYRNGRRRVGQLRRAGDHWMAVDGAELWRDSRAAKRQLEAATAFAAALAAQDSASLTWPISPSCAPTPVRPPRPATSPETSPPSRSARPALRLVRAERARETDGECASRET